MAIGAAGPGLPWGRLPRNLPLAIKQLFSSTSRGVIDVSCLGRGVNLFGPDAAELNQIQAKFGDFPLVGFYAIGEISQDRVYGYTGVLTLFTD